MGFEFWLSVVRLLLSPLLRLLLLEARPVAFWWYQSLTSEGDI